MELFRDLIADVRISTWVAVGVLAAVAVMALALAQWRPFRRALASGAARRAAAPVPTSIIESLMVRESRRLSGAALGGIIGLLAGTYFVYVIGADRGQPATVLLVGSFAIGGAAGRSVASCLGALTRGTSSIRVANVRHRGVEDYMPAWARIATRSTVALAVVTLALLSLSPRLWGVRTAVFPSTVSVGALVTALAAVSLVACEVGSRVIAHFPQWQNSEIAVIRDDSLRSSAIADLASSTWLLGFFGLLFGAQELARALSPGVLRGIASAPAFDLLGTAAMVAALCVMALPHTRGYAIRRLHPEPIGKTVS